VTRRCAELRQHALEHDARDVAAPAFLQHAEPACDRAPRQLQQGERGIVLPVEVLQQRGDGEADVAPHQLGDGHERVELEELPRHQPQPAQQAVDARARLRAPVESNERMAREQARDGGVGIRDARVGDDGQDLLVASRPSQALHLGPLGLDDHRRVELAARDVLHQLLLLAHAQHDLEAGMPQLQLRHGTRQQADRRDQRTELDGAADLPRPALQIASHRLVLQQKLLGARQQQMAGRAQRHAAAGLLEQPRVHLGLERTHLLAHRGLGQRHAVGRRGE